MDENGYHDAHVYWKCSYQETSAQEGFFQAVASFSSSAFSLGVGLCLLKCSSIILVVSVGTAWSTMLDFEVPMVSSIPLVVPTAGKNILGANGFSIGEAPLEGFRKMDFLGWVSDPSLLRILRIGPTDP
nr:hypothetical protein Iba_chr13aCG13070 [Ipomoea batatas]GMD78879.1 hypothetical protein Iba_chr13cCG17210 [Ipomoea batatas]